MRVLLGVVAAVVGLALGAAGCGTSHPSAAPTTSSSAAGVASTATTGAPTTVAPTTVSATTSVTSSSPTTAQVPTSSGSTASPIAACTSADFSPSFHEGNGASGVVLYEIDATNASSAPCRTGGYFGVSVYSVPGRLISQSDQRQPLGVAAPAVLTVAPGATVNFQVGLATSPDRGTCVPAGALHLIAPNDTGHVQVATTIPTGQYITMCGTTISVGPVQPGVAAVIR